MTEMKLKTSRGNEYTIQWAAATERAGGMLMLMLLDGRKLSEIAAEFEGVERFERISEQQGDEVYEGFTRLEAISRQGDEVQMKLVREAAQDGHGN